MGLSGGVASLFTYPYVRDADWFAAGVPPYGNLYEYQRKQDTMTDLPQSLPQAWRPPMGWNSWDSYGTTLTEDELLANARFMAEHLKNAGWDTLVIDIDWYDPTARAHGYNDNAPLILDEYGRQLPDPVRFPSAAGGKGFGPLAAAVHELGLKLGMHMMRGIPRIAVDKNLPVYGTNYTAKDVADLDHVCKWNPDNYGLNQSHPGAQAWYDAQLDLFASWGLDFLKVDDMQTPFHSDEIAAYHRAIAKAEAKYGRSIDLSLSPGGWVATSYVDFLRENAQMWRISDDLWDRWEDIYQQFARLARWAPFQTTGHWADADMVPFGHIGLRAERGDDRQSRLTLDEQKTLLALWCMGRSPLMVGGDLPTSNSDAIALLQNPALREVLAGSTNNRETVRERILANGGMRAPTVASSSSGPPTQPIGPMAHVPRITAAITPRCSGPAATHTRSAATSSSNPSWGLTPAMTIGHSPICMPTRRASPPTCVLKAWVPTASSPARFRRTACSGWPWTDAETEPASANQPPEPTARIVWRNLP